jgi:putative hemolysin
MLVAGADRLRREGAKMSSLWPQLGLVAFLVLVNAVFAGSELALVSLREGQLRRLEAKGGAGPVLARLARDPNRFLATLQIGITLAGFLASASAAVALAAPLEEPLSFLGSAAGPSAIVVVTLLLTYVTLVFGELAPKRVAMQRAERWALLVARPLAAMATLTRPVVWALGRSANLAVRLMGGDPSAHREDITEEELRDMVALQPTFTAQQRAIISGAFEVADRSLHEIVRPRPDVLVFDPAMPASEAVGALVAAGHSRAPVADASDLDHVVGVVHLRDLVQGATSVREAARPALFFPETIPVLDALRAMQAAHQQLAVVVNEHGGGEGIITVEDLVEEIVGEIYDESDRDVLGVIHEPGGALVLSGRYPVHDLKDLGVDAPVGEYATVAGLVLDVLGRIPTAPGDEVRIGDWIATVLSIDRRAITRVRLRPGPPARVGRD